MNRSFTLSKESLSIEISTICNCHCIHCFVKANHEKDHKLSYETLREIIVEGYDIGYRNLHLTGGEPLLHESFFLILEYAFSLGYENIFCNSNGLFFDNECCSRLSKYSNRLFFSVSLHGNEEIHNKLSAADSYHRVCHGISSALNNNLNVSIFTSVGKTLLPYLGDFTRMIFGDFPAIKELVFLQMIRGGNSHGRADLEFLSPEDFIKFVKIISRIVMGGLRVRVLDNPLFFAAAQLFGFHKVFEKRKISLPGRLIINADKTITISHERKEILGQYRPGILRDILFSGDYLNLTSEDRDICPKCDFYKICSKIGMQSPDLLLKDMDAGVFYCKKVLNFILEKNKNRQRVV